MLAERRKRSFLSRPMEKRSTFFPQRVYLSSNYSGSQFKPLVDVLDKSALYARRREVS